MNKKDWLEILGALVSASLVLLWSTFTMYYFLLVSMDQLPPETRDHQNMILGGLIGLLGVFTKIMIDKFAEGK